MSRQPCTATESPNHWCASSCTTVLRPIPVEYVGLVWFSREKPGWSAGGQAAGLAERVVAEPRLQPGDDLGGPLHQLHPVPPHRRRQLLGHGHQPGQAVLRAARDLEAARREEREVRHHRLVGDPAVRHPLARAQVPRDQAAVGDDLLAARHRDRDVDQGLVERVVVGREPPGRHVRLVHGHDLVVARQPVALAAVAVAPGPAGVPDHHVHGLPRLQRGLRRDDELVVLGRLVVDRGAAVHGDPVDRQQEVEVEGRQVLGGAQPDPGLAAQAARRRSGTRRRCGTAARRSRRCRRAGSTGRRCPPRPGPVPDARRPRPHPPTPAAGRSGGRAGERQRPAAGASRSRVDPTQGTLVNWFGRRPRHLSHSSTVARSSPVRRSVPAERSVTCP